MVVVAVMVVVVAVVAMVMVVVGGECQGKCPGVSLAGVPSR